MFFNWKFFGSKVTQRPVGTTAKLEQNLQEQKFNAKTDNSIWKMNFGFQLDADELFLENKRLNWNWYRNTPLMKNSSKNVIDRNIAERVD